MPRAVFVLSLLLSFGIPSIANGNEHCREFVLFTQPKTGTYLLSPFLQKLSYRRQHFATMCDFSKYPRPAFSEEEFEDCLDREGYVPVFMHHLTIPNEDYLINLERLATSAEYFACHTPYSRQLDKLLDERNCVVFL